MRGLDTRKAQVTAGWSSPWRVVALGVLAGLLTSGTAMAQMWNRLGPGTRDYASAVYDQSTNRFIIFGGQHSPKQINFNDLWYADNALPQAGGSSVNLSWQMEAPRGFRPPERYGHSAIYDATNKRMVVFGGGTGFPGSCVNDLWLLTGANSNPAGQWFNQAFTGTAPSARRFHTAVYDATGNRMIVFGGSDCVSSALNDVWVLTNANANGVTPVWTQLNPGGTPPPVRMLSSAVYDPGSNTMVVYGGTDATTTTIYSDVWALSNANGVGGTPVWTQLSTGKTGPKARFGHVAAYDSTNNRMMVFGGVAKGAPFSDSWVLTGANGKAGAPAWVQVTPTPTIGGKRFGAAIYDPGTNQLGVFGGASNSISSTDDHISILTHANGLQ